MHRPSILVPAFLALASHATAHTQTAPDALPEARTEITLEELDHHLRTLAAEALAGRRTGSDGARRAQDYLERALERAGLERAGPEAGFSLAIEARRVTPVGEPRLLLHRRDGTVEEARLGIDFTLERRGALRSTGRLDLLRLSESKDLRGVEPDGGRALFVRYEPDQREEQVTLGRLERAGGWGLVVEVADSETERPRHAPEGARLAIGAGEADACERVVLYGAKRETLLWLGYVALELVAEERSEPFPVANVLARVPGADPARAGESILLHAAYDSGQARATRSRDETGPASAAEAASACAALLEVAERLAQDPPARSVVLLFTIGSEHGELGLETFLESAPVPLETLGLALGIERLGVPEDAGALYLAGRQAPELAARFTAHGAPVEARAPEERRQPSVRNRLLGRAGVPARTLECAGPTRRLAPAADRPEALDHEHLLRVTRRLEALVRAAASDSFELPAR